jgi:hypothetical protein
MEEDSMGWTRAFCPLCGIAATKYRIAPQYARELWNRRVGEPEHSEAQRDLELIREKTKVDTLDDGWKAMVRTIIRLAEKEE